MYIWHTGPEPQWPHLLPAVPNRPDNSLRSQISSEQKALQKHPSHCSDGKPGDWNVDLDEKEETGRGKCWEDPEGNAGVRVVNGGEFRMVGGRAGEDKGQIESLTSPMKLLVEGPSRAMLRACVHAQKRRVVDSRDGTGVWDLSLQPRGAMATLALGLMRGHLNFTHSHWASSVLQVGPLSC